MCRTKKTKVNQKKDQKLCYKLRRCRHYVKTVNVASQREDDGRLQSVIQFLRMTGIENLLPVCRRRGSRRGA